MSFGKSSDSIRFPFVECSERLRRLRENRKETYASLGQAIGVSEQTLKNYEQAAIHGGRSTGQDRVTKIAGMSINTLCLLADHFGVSTDYLLGLTEHPTVSEDMKTALKVTGLSERAIKNAKQWDTWMLTRLMETDGFTELIIDIENMYEVVQILEDKYLSIINGTSREPVFEYNEYSPLVQAVVSQAKKPGQPEDDLIRLYDFVRLESYELRDSFAAIIEKIVPTKALLSSVKTLLREYGGLSASSANQGENENDK